MAELTINGERHEVDVSQGHYPPLPFKYLGLCEISVDGAQTAEGIIDVTFACSAERIIGARTRTG